MRTTGKRRFLAGMILLAAAVAVFCWRYTVVNAECPPAQLEAYHLGEPVLHNGVEYTLSDYRVLAAGEFCEEYDVDPYYVEVAGTDSKIIVVTMYAKNTSDQEVEVDFGGQMLLQIGDYMCTYYCYYPLFAQISPDKPTGGIMLPGHDITVTFPYQILEMPWNQVEFARLEQEETQIVFSLYPVKKSILLNEAAAQQ